MNKEDDHDTSKGNVPPYGRRSSLNDSANTGDARTRMEYDAGDDDGPQRRGIAYLDSQKTQRSEGEFRCSQQVAEEKGRPRKFDSGHAGNQLWPQEENDAGSEHCYRIDYEQPLQVHRGLVFPALACCSSQHGVFGTAARSGRQGSIAEHLTWMDFIVLDELGYLPFAKRFVCVDPPERDQMRLD